jgi:hypothetical protein
MRPILFIDRDGVILQEPATDFQIDHIEKTSFQSHVQSAPSFCYSDLSLVQKGSRNLRYPSRREIQLFLDRVKVRLYTHV